MKNVTFTMLVIVALAIVGVSSAHATETPYELEWVSQLGTSTYDDSESVAIDGSGNAYISGRTEGSLDGPTAGYSDVFLAKYDASGALLWTRQLGTSNFDNSYSVAIDNSGNAYISGGTLGDLDGPNAGFYDAFLAKYDDSGALLWTRQLGTNSTDYSESVAIDSSGNAYISGYTYGSLGGTNAGSADAFLAKYDASGALLWTRQLGTSTYDDCWSVAIDGSGNAYISGYTYGSLDGTNAGSYDAFLTKYDSSGSLLWTKQLGTYYDDRSYAVAIDGSGNAYISGLTGGDLGGTNAGSNDAFLAKYDDSGALLWTRQLGTSSSDSSRSVAIDGSGNAYISGCTGGGFGSPYADVFLAKYDDSGELLWTRQFGTSGDDGSRSVAIDGSGNAYISGYTYGSLDGTNAGDYDAFLARFSPVGQVVPEPGTIAMIAAGALGLAGVVRRKMR